MADPLEPDLRLLLHDAIAHVEAGFYKVEHLSGSTAPDHPVYELAKMWRENLSNLVAEMRTGHDTLTDACDVCGCPKRSA